MSEAQAKLTEAIDDVTQSILRKSLTDGLPKLMHEHGVLADQPKGQAAQPDAKAAADGGAAPAAAADLKQPEDRHPRIKAFIEQLHRDYNELEKLTARDMLDI